MPFFVAAQLMPNCSPIEGPDNKANLIGGQGAFLDFSRFPLRNPL